ncbi:hypothetical protein KPH14_006346 [Odynerus spinipes]|uniref:Glutathione S-transferase n=1 Tax=Odynerus spinipes TaxID=1348599 RepID=A0AAD9VWC8_9HYME|nr:hypothetical protein KPH14_006346 [Odynerus spinipes]
MPIDLYHLPSSPPCRAVRLAASVLGVELNLKEVNLMAGEQNKPEFIKMNPQHVIPTIDDNGFYLWESRAIMAYLAEQYGKDDSLYPKDPKKRAVVNQRLFFDQGTLYQSFADFFYPMVFGAPRDETKFEKIGTAIGFLEKFLENQNYVAGKNMTIADLTIAATISQFEVIKYDLSKYKNVAKCDYVQSAYPCLEAGTSAYFNFLQPKTIFFFAERKTEKLKLTLTLFTYDKNAADCNPPPGMSLDLYYMPFSAPCRAVMLTAEALGLSLNLKQIDLFAGEHLKPEYEQLNPQKSIPFLVDGDYKLSESRAIMSYLVDQYGRNARLYPQTPAARALVNQRLYFDIGTLYKNMSAYFYPVAFFGVETYDEEQYEKLKGAFEVLDAFLDGQDYAAGRSLTIADLALASSVSTAEALGFDLFRYKYVVKWMDRVKASAPGYRKANGEGLEILKKFVADRKSQ